MGSLGAPAGPPGAEGWRPAGARGAEPFHARVAQRSRASGGGGAQPDSAVHLAIVPGPPHSVYRARVPSFQLDRDPQVPGIFSRGVLGAYVSLAPHARRDAAPCGRWHRGLLPPTLRAAAQPIRARPAPSVSGTGSTSAAF